MKIKSLGLLAAAAVCGLVAMVGVMKAMQNGGERREPNVRVAVAVTNIAPGMPLDDRNVTFKELPASGVPSGAVRKPEQIAGKTLSSRAVPGETLMEAKLAGAEAITPSHEIPEGMRVTTVGVNATKSHSGLIRPTDRVDVVCSYTAQDADRRQVTHVKTILEFVEVFAVDALRGDGEGEVSKSVKNVSLLVTPEQSQLLTAAERLGDLHLALRNRSDTKKTEVAALSDKVFFDARTSSSERKAEDDTVPVATEPVMMTQPAPLPAPAAAVATPDPVEIPEWTMTIGRGEAMSDVTVLDETRLAPGTSARERQRMRAGMRQPSGSEAAAAPARSGQNSPAGTTSPASAAPATPTAALPEDSPFLLPEPSGPTVSSPASHPTTTVPAAILPWPTTSGQPGL